MIKPLGAFVIGTMAIGGLLQMTGWTFAPPPMAIAVFAVVAMLATLTAVIWLYRNGRFFHGLLAMPPALALERQRYIEIDSMPKPARTIGAPPVRVPSPWAIAMAEDLKWIDRQMAMHGVSDLIRVISSYQLAEAQAVVKELHAAKRVIRGEIAS